MRARPLGAGEHFVDDGALRQQEYEQCFVLLDDRKAFIVLDRLRYPVDQLTLGTVQV